MNKIMKITQCEYAIWKKCQVNNPQCCPEQPTEHGQ